MATTIVFNSMKKWDKWYDILDARSYGSCGEKSITSYGLKAITIFNDDYAMGVLQELKAARVGINKVLNH